MIAENPIPEETEAIRLIARVAQRDSAALDELYRRYHRPVYALALRTLSQHVDAEEVLQDTFVRVWKYAPGYNPERASPLSWIMMMARSLCLDRLRKRQRTPQMVEIESTREDGEPGTQHAVEAAATPSERDALGQHLAALPSNQRQPIELAFYQGLSHPEIATRLRRPLGSIKSDIRRGLLRLREFFQDTPTQ